MSSALPAPLVDGRFQLQEVIGEGGMATVYRAYDTRLRRTLAIKVLSPALAGRVSLRNRFLGEARAMVRLTDGRIVRVLDSGEEGDRAYIIMELVEGGSLLDRVRDFGPLPPRMAAKVALDLCEALQHAHEQGVIHRDIKPHNILLTRAGQIRITDFGIAQVQDDEGGQLTRTGAVMGTWGFMAPEQKSDARKVDHRADVYSVGATLWSILRGETPPELFMADQEPQMLDGIPEELVAIIRRATRYRREDRYPTMREMANSVSALLPLIEPDPEDALPLCPPRPPRPEVARPEVPGTAGGVPNLAAAMPASSAGPPSVATSPSAPPRPSDPPSEPRATPVMARPETIVPDATPFGTAPPAPRASSGPAIARPTPSASAGPSVGPSPSASLASSVGPSPAGLSPAAGVAPAAEREGVSAAPAESPWLRWGLTLGLAALVAVGIAVGYTFLAGSPPPPAPEAPVPTEAVQPGPDLGAAGEAAPAGDAAAGLATAVPVGPGAPLSPAPTTAAAGSTTTTPGSAPVPTSPVATGGTAATDAPAAGAIAAVRTSPAGTVAAEVPATAAPAAEVAPPADTSRPFLTVAAPSSAKVGQELSFEAQALPGWTVHLYYRAAGTSSFKDRTLTGDGGRYAGTVTVDDAMAGGLEYFVEATNGVGGKLFEGRYSSPRTVAVSP